MVAPTQEAKKDLQNEISSLNTTFSFKITQNCNLIQKIKVAALKLDSRYQ